MLSAVQLSWSPSNLLRQSLSLEVALTNFFLNKILLFLYSKHWNFMSISSHPNSTWVWKSRLKSSWLCGKLFTNENMFITQWASHPQVLCKWLQLLRVQGCNDNATTKKQCLSSYFPSSSVSSSMIVAQLLRGWWYFTLIIMKELTVLTSTRNSMKEKMYR